MFWRIIFCGFFSFFLSFLPIIIDIKTTDAGTHRDSVDTSKINRRTILYQHYISCARALALPHTYTHIIKYYLPICSIRAYFWDVKICSVSTCHVLRQYVPLFYSYFESTIPRRPERKVQKHPTHDEVFSRNVLEINDTL